MANKENGISYLTLRNNTGEQIRIDQRRVLRVLGSSKAHNRGPLTVQTGDEDSICWVPIRGTISSFLASHDQFVVRIGDDFKTQLNVEKLPKDRDFVMGITRMGPYTIEVLQKRTRSSFDVSLAVYRGVPRCITAEIPNGCFK